MYATSIGFGTRLHWITRGAKGTITRRRIVCNKEGKRDENWLNKKDRVHYAKQETREMCLAACCSHCEKVRGTDVITEFISEHSHTLAMNRESHFFCSNRHVSDADLAHVNAMRSCSISTSMAFDYLVNSKGGFKFVGHTSKELYNRLESERRAKLIKGDAQCAIDWMNDRAFEDSRFRCKFGVDEEGRLANIFWRDSTSLYDYICFGDVLIFDSTYKTNVYNRPLAVFVGTNNHKATIVFACALLVDETAATYKWALETFLDAMEGMKPISVLTDGDEAMRKAITQVFPEAKHRICSWHIGMNMGDKIKDVDRRKEFRKCIYSSLSVAELEVTWHNMIKKMEEEGLSESVESWLQLMYNKKERWAEAFFTGHFFAGMTSTQRCEGMNKHLKFDIGKGAKLYEILPRITRTLRRMRNDVIKDDYRCRNSKPVLITHMTSVENMLAAKLTHDMYKLARLQIRREKKYIVTKKIPFSDSAMYYLTQYKKADREWTVELHNVHSDKRFTCSCMLYESDGIPCAHIFSVMKFDHLDDLPDSLIHERWTKAAREPYNDLSHLQNGSNMALQTRRCIALHSVANSSCYDGSLTGDGFKVISAGLAKFKIEGEKYHGQHNEMIMDDASQNQDGQNHPNVVKDPEIHKSKKVRQVEENDARAEAGKTDRRCSYCSLPGHNIKTCQKKEADMLAKEASRAAQAPLNGETQHFGPNNHSKSLLSHSSTETMFPSMSQASTHPMFPMMSHDSPYTMFPSMSQSSPRTRLPSMSQSSIFYPDYNVFSGHANVPRFWGVASTSQNTHMHGSTSESTQWHN